MKKRKPVDAHGHTVKELRKLGCIVGRTEHYNHHTKRKSDLFGFIDMVALPSDGSPIKAIQATSWDAMGARARKIMNECAEASTQWLKSGGVIEVWGWRRKEVPTKSGGTKIRLEHRVFHVEL